MFDVLAPLDADGCARYVVSDVSRDGTLTGPNADVLREVSAATDRPVIASGGISSLDDLCTLATLAGLEGRDRRKSEEAMPKTCRSGVALATPASCSRSRVRAHNRGRRPSKTPLSADWRPAR